MEYRGVEIDGSILKSEKDVDEFSGKINSRSIESCNRNICL